MQRRTFCQVVGQACVAAYIGPVGLEASTDIKGRPSAVSQTLRADQKPVDEASDWATISTLLEDASSTYHEPWDDATNRTLMKGAYLGNGDLGAHLGGSRHSLIYYLGKNGFHAGNDTVGFRSGDESAPGPYKQHILNLARLTIEAAAETAKADSPSDYSVTQDLKNAEIRTESFMAGASVKTRAYLSPSSNVLVLELSTSGGKDLHLQAALSVIGNASVAQRGVEFEGSFTSHGTPSTAGGTQGGEDCCMATNAVFAILPIVWKWKYGRDTQFLAKTAYPLMRSVADFFDDYIGAPVNGRYEVYGSVHEGANWFAKNDLFSLGAIRFLYREIVAASIELRCDADRRAHWQDILDHMSEYPLQAWGSKVTFRPDAVHDVMEALHYQGGARNTGVMFTTTFDNMSHRTLPAYRIATCNTLDRGNMFHPQRWCGWQNGNDFGMMFVMAVRAGYRADRVIQAIKGWKPKPNGVVSQKDGGGIETAGIIEAINGMLLQSQDGVIRIFPNWDRSVDAEFHRLRSVGAFLVGARYRAAGRRVDSVRIFSERGNLCIVQSPFDEACITVTRADTGQAVLLVQDEDEFTFRTTAGVTYQIARTDCAPAAIGAPVITTHPADATVGLPEAASFSVSATGDGLRFQWQKNRADILGATHPTYTTPATTLWDIGSEYRCVISNASGTIRSRPGTLVAPEKF